MISLSDHIINNIPTVFHKWALDSGEGSEYADLTLTCEVEVTLSRLKNCNRKGEGRRGDIAKYSSFTDDIVDYKHVKLFRSRKKQDFSFSITVKRLIYN